MNGAKGGGEIVCLSVSRRLSEGAQTPTDDEKGTKGYRDTLHGLTMRADVSAYSPVMGSE